jgi:HAD superfamily hydrolase (TIGR01509 family)
MIRAVIFDFDGLILDTEVPDFESWQEVYVAYGCHLAFDQWADSIGTAELMFDVYAELERQLGQSIERATLRQQRRARYLALVEQKAVLPGVADYLADARRLGLHLAVASSSPHDWVDGHLARLGLLHHFDCIRCADDVRRTKPDPELYLAVLAALELRPSEAVVLEDSPNGLLAARRAGIPCVAVPNALTARLSLDHADLRLTSLADLPLEDLLQRLQAPAG